ncbi:hypothetical protein [Zavarzinella formosa]|uniref:hypothetical protein n=1 Tax=Zavarzinella formosa TaxID=360055 RepID=UPI0012FBB0A0|nr:hypothetical protein [Zavarzinella formosa]
MQASQATLGERLTLSRIHAVLAAFSAAMIGQIISANNYSHSLEYASGSFAASMLLNVLFYVWESEPTTQKCKSLTIGWLLHRLHDLAFLTVIIGVSCMLLHVSRVIGFAFCVCGNVLASYFSWSLRRVSLSHLQPKLEKIEQISEQIDKELDQLKLKAREFTEGKERIANGQDLDKADYFEKLRCQINVELEELSKKLKENGVLQASIVAEKNDLLERKLQLIPKILHPATDKG